MSVDVILYILMCFFTFLTGWRLIIAARFFRHMSKTQVITAYENEITVLQPILAGDPTLENNLNENLDNAPNADFIWLLNKEDRLGKELIEKILNERHSDKKRISVVVCNTVPHGFNPKTFKLETGFHLCKSKFLAVLDDDTVLQRGALSRVASLCSDMTIVTGLPYYILFDNFWSSLLCGFVNSNTLVSYPPIALLSKPRTLNGMFYILKKADLEHLGGFQSIVNELCDDYAIAQLYSLNNGKIIQSSELHSIRTSVLDFSHYFSVIRRWMIFANRFLKQNISFLLFMIVILPSVLPLILITLAIFKGFNDFTLVLIILFMKATIMSVFRTHIIGSKEGLKAIAYEVLADIIMPIENMTAYIRSNRFTWRSVRIHLDNDKIRYL